ncbi:hypothetical protein BD410DRAFT_791643 [Rickenella mellea]|uniref:DUF6534 domain-containing protein n=1 Tax=Rickenella mellea TaxID=50990 RepID=A0A4Y7PXN4_9AGAM|nr:hypothetical protein BD410DRAFT_791643 [Rickenella mellea]
MSTTPVFELPALDNTFGAMFIGLLIATGLYGILCLQCYLCFQQYPTDRFAKSIVGTLWVLNTFHIVIIGHAVYGYLITNFSHPLALLDATWDITSHIVINSFIAYLVQLFFAHRVWKFTNRNIYLGGIVVILATVQFAFAVATTVKAFQLKAFSRLLEIKTTIASSLAITVACDVVVTGILCLYLNRSRTGFKRTDSLINNLIWYSVSTGLLPSIFATLQLITYFAMPNNFVNICFSLFLGKLYSNSLLATLNGRATTRAKWGMSDGNVQLSQLSSQGGTRVGAVGKDSVAIFVGQTTEIKTDFQPAHSHSLGDFDKYNSESGHHV